MTHYPLVITFQGALFGRGFVVEVSARGRVLAAREAPDRWWFYGVNPGAIAARGASLEEAHADYRRALRAILVQFAIEAPSFDAFKVEVERFFHATNAPTDAEWQDAVTRVRAKRERLHGLPVTRADEAAVSVRVVVKPQGSVTPDDNRVRVEAAVAEAA